MASSAAVAALPPREWSLLLAATLLACMEAQQTLQLDKLICIVGNSALRGLVCVCVLMVAALQSGCQVAGALGIHLMLFGVDTQRLVIRLLKCNLGPPHCV